MPTPHEILEIAPTAGAAEIKAAYHTKLKQFPAHTHPQEFKDIRAAYETLRKGEGAAVDDFLAIKPLEVKLDEALVEQMKERAIAQFTVSFEEMVRGTF